MARRRRETIAEARTPDGETITLAREGGHFLVTCAGELLMSSAAHHSESRMAEVGLEGARADASVLIGGLGMGYTLRGALDLLGPDGRVDVAELVPAVVEWNRGVLGPLADHPLHDARATLRVDDVSRHLGAPGRYDAILLDVDNGPEAFAAEDNRHLYSVRGLRRIHRALRPRGALVVWSAYQSPPFMERLRAAGFTPKAVRAKARGAKGSRHTLYVGRRD